jgi:hypothetical protein
LSKYLITVVLLAGLVAASIVFAGRVKTYHLFGNQEGYEPVQPIAFSHRKHAGDLQIQCVYCHSGAESSPHAGIPAADICMNCHRFVTDSSKVILQELLDARKEKRKQDPKVSPELEKLYHSLALTVTSDGKLERDPKRQPEPIAWVKVHNLPAFTCFNHSAHVKAGVDCQQCHGPVETMERVRQVADLSMGWCVDCHRQRGLMADTKAAKPSTDCATCHH